MAELDEARKNLLLCWKCENISVMREESLSQILDCPQGLTGCWNEWLQLDEPQKPVPDRFRETVDTWQFLTWQTGVQTGEEMVVSRSQNNVKTEYTYVGRLKEKLFFDLSKYALSYWIYGSSSWIFYSVMTHKWYMLYSCLVDWLNTGVQGEKLRCLVQRHNLHLLLMSNKSSHFKPGLSTWQFLWRTAEIVLQCLK